MSCHSRSVFLKLFSSFLLGGTSLHAVPFEGLTAYWRFDSDFSNSLEASGNAAPTNPANLDLTPGSLSAPVMDAGAGIRGGAARFNASSAQFLELDGGGDVISDNPLSNYTISVWFKADSAPAGEERFFIYETSPAYTLSLGIREDESNTENTLIQFYSNTTTVNQPLSMSFLDSDIADQWVHTVVTWDGLNLSAQVSDQVKAIQIPGNPEFLEFDDFHVGTYRRADDRFFSGLIDELAIWDRVLTPEEISSLDTSSIVVNSTVDDHVLNDGSISLREAIAEAFVGGTITFDPSLSGATILLNGQLMIDKDLNIDASSLAKGIIIDGNGAVTGERVFEIQSDTSCVFDALTITNGLANDLNGGFAGGGGILVNVAADLTLNRSTLAGNSAFFGGAIFNNSSLTINSCTLTGNSAPQDAGGAVYTRYGQMTINHSTITGNSTKNTGGGYYRDSGPAVLLNNSIVAGNTSLGINPNIGNGFSGTNNLTSGDPVLEPLGDYGGPTQTMPPLPGSPAIDAGGTPTELTDQRGLPRIIGPSADIGAVEFQMDLVVQNTNDDGVGSLRQTVSQALFGVTITFAPWLAGETIRLTSGQILIEKDLTIDASALANGITIDGNSSGRSRIFEIGDGAISLSGLTLTGGDVRQNSISINSAGGAILVGAGASLALDDCLISGNGAFFGGGIFCGGDTVLTRCTISKNQGSGLSNGAGIASFPQGPVILDRCTISENFGRGFLSDHGAPATFTQCTIAENKWEGIIVFAGQPITITQCTITNNGGNGISNNFGNVTLTNSIVTGNLDTNVANFSSADGDQPVFNGINNLTSGDSLLAPLGDHGGPTETAPLREGSPAIDAGVSSALGTDQRGQPRAIGASVDLGAVEYQGGSEFALWWHSDWDRDGIVFGVEHALGTAPDSPDPRSPFDVAINGAEREITFERNPLADLRTIWIVSRSFDLSVGSFEEIFRYTDSGLPFEGPEIFSDISPDMIKVTDQNTPAAKVFYRFEAELAP